MHTSSGHSLILHTVHQKISAAYPESPGKSVPLPNGEVLRALLQETYDSLSFMVLWPMSMIPKRDDTLLAPNQAKVCRPYLLHTSVNYKVRTKIPVEG